MHIIKTIPMVLGTLLFLGCGENIPTENQNHQNQQNNQNNQQVTSTKQDNGLKYQNFAVTTLRYNYNSNWNRQVQKIFGADYRVADWNDLENYQYQSGGNLLTLLNGLGVRNYGSRLFVTRDGFHYYSSRQAYFISRHEHFRPNNYYSLDEINNHLLTLSSGMLSLRILAIRVNYENEARRGRTTFQTTN